MAIFDMIFIATLLLLLNIEAQISKHIIEIAFQNCKKMTTIFYLHC